MGILNRFNKRLATIFITDFENIDRKDVRIRYGVVAGWFGIISTIVLFIIKMTLGVMAGAVSVVANAFHLLSHLANSVILVVTFKVTSRPATEKNPFGHGRMEHVAPLIMSIFLFLSGIQLCEVSIHQVLKPHEIHYWAALPWILLLTIIVKQWLASFVRYLGKRVNSEPVLANAYHHNLEALMSLMVIGGLVGGHYFHFPETDGYVGVLVSFWLLFLGYAHGRKALVPLLGQAPDKGFIKKIREAARSVDGVEDVHEIIVHDYGSMYSISIHAEIPEKFGPAKMHEISEQCEEKLRESYGCEAVCHTDPVLEKTPEIEAIEKIFGDILHDFPQINRYHDFRVVADSNERIIIVADLDIKEHITDEEFPEIQQTLEKEIQKKLENVSYCSFYITPKFAY